MVIRNRSRKIIGFGNVNVLPEQTEEISDAFLGNATLDAYVNLGFVEIVSGAQSREEVAAPKTSRSRKTATEQVEE